MIKIFYRNEEGEQREKIFFDFMEDFIKEWNVEYKIRHAIKMGRLTGTPRYEIKLNSGSIHIVLTHPDPHRADFTNRTSGYYYHEGKDQAVLYVKLNHNDEVAEGVRHEREEEYPSLKSKVVTLFNLRRELVKEKLFQEVLFLEACEDQSSSLSSPPIK